MKKYSILLLVQIHLIGFIGAQTAAGSGILFCKTTDLLPKVESKNIYQSRVAYVESEGSIFVWNGKGWAKQNLIKNENDADSLKIEALEETVALQNERIANLENQIQKMDNAFEKMERLTTKLAELQSDLEHCCETMQSEVLMAENQKPKVQKTLPKIQLDKCIPNPASDEISIHYMVSNEFDDLSLEIFNDLGLLVERIPNLNNEEGTVGVNISNFGLGTFRYVLKNGQEVLSSNEFQKF